MNGVSVFQDVKIWLILTFDLSRDALHIYIGLIVFLGAAALFRRSLGSWLPVSAAIAAAFAGEAWDWIDDAGLGREHVYYSQIHDLWNTIFWPAALFLLARFTMLLKR